MVDRYTKMVLTVIAVALTVMAVRDVTLPARAQVVGPAHVIVDDVAPYALQFAGPLQVHTAQ